MDNPLVSICIPVYNVSTYIEQCVRSLFEQTFHDVEYIFVDDCSPDDSINKIENTLKTYSNRKDQVKIIRHDHNCGLAAARNTAIKNASGVFVMHVDSDDWLEKDAIESLVRKQQETNADIVSGNAMAHYSDHEKQMIEPMYESKLEMMLRMIELTIDHVIWRRLIRKSLYTDNGICAIEGVNIGEDHHTLPRLIYYANNCVPLGKIVYHYNCMNEMSYMNATTKQALESRFYSDLSSINILLDFFKSRDAKCYGRLNEIKSEFINSRLMAWYYEGDAHNYNKMIRELYSMDREYLAKVGIVNFKQMFIRRTFFRFHTYNCIKNRLLNLVNRWYCGKNS